MAEVEEVEEVSNEKKSNAPGYLLLFVIGWGALGVVVWLVQMVLLWRAGQ